MFDESTVTHRRPPPGLYDESTSPWYVLICSQMLGWWLPDTYRLCVILNMLHGKTKGRAGNKEVEDREGGKRGGATEIKKQQGEMAGELV